MARVIRLKNDKEYVRSLISLVSNGKLTIEKQIEKEGRLLIRNVLIETPPQSGGALTGAKARQAGERTVSAQIRRVISGVDVRTARKMVSSPKKGEKSSLTMKDLERHHKRARKNGKIVGKKRTGKKLLFTSKKMLNDYIKARKKKVGALAAGWNAAAKKFGLKGRYWPAWVKRHNMPSSADFKLGNGFIKIKFVNAVRFAGNVGVMGKALDRALYRQTRNNDKIMNNWKKTAARQGFRVR